MSKNKKFTTKQLTTNAMLAAMCAVLGYVAIDLGTVKLTFEGFPVLIGSLLFGPVDGMLIGGIGTLVYQLLRYGFDPTTVLWILPYILSGLLMGLYAKKANYHYEPKTLVPMVILNELMVTTINTLSLFVYFWNPVDIRGSIIYVLSKLPIRLLIAVVKAIVYSMVIPYILKALRTVTSARTTNA